MNKKDISAVALAVSAVLAASVAFAQESSTPIPPAIIAPVIPPVPERALAHPRVPRAAVPAISNEEAQPAQSSNPSADISPVPGGGSTLSPPITITYSGSSNALTISDSGKGRGLSSSLTNSNDSLSAVYGETKGSGAGVKGINSGTTGSGGVFEVTDTASSQPALSASTSGPGPAIVATADNRYGAALLVTNTATHGAKDTGIGIETSGYGGGILAGSDGGEGVYGISNSNIGVIGESETSYGVYGISDRSVGVYGAGYSTGVYASSVSGVGLYAASDSNYAIFAQSKNTIGVLGEDLGSGIGVYGYSVSGYAGYFAGKVAATAFQTLSDRNAKTAFVSVSGSDILERISALPITSWRFKGDSAHRHVGPMAQDFHAAFGLNGEDDTHINLSDSAGVSLVAIQELNKRLKVKDAQIGALQAQLKAMNDRFSARMAKLEQRNSGSTETVTASLQSARVSALPETSE